MDSTTSRLSDPNYQNVWTIVLKRHDGLRGANNNDQIYFLISMIPNILLNEFTEKAHKTNFNSY